AVAVGFAQAHAVDAQQGVSLGLHPVQGQVAVQIGVVFIKGFGVGVAVQLGDVQNVVGFVERQVAVAFIVQMGLVIDLGLVLAVGVKVGGWHHRLPSKSSTARLVRAFPSAGTRRAK